MTIKKLILVVVGCLVLSLGAGTTVSHGQTTEGTSNAGVAFKAGPPTPAPTEVVKTVVIEKVVKQKVLPKTGSEKKATLSVIGVCIVFCVFFLYSKLNRREET